MPCIYQAKETIMMVIVGVREDLCDSKASAAIKAFGDDAGVQDVRVNCARPHLMFVEYDENQLKWPDIINHMDQIGLHGKVCGN
jgi:hypothetical protein